MTLRLAASDYTFPKLEWEQVLRLAADLGVEAVDSGLFDGRSHLRPEDVLLRPSHSAVRVIRAFDSCGLQVADVFGQPAAAFQELAVNHPEPGQRQKAAEFYRRLLEFAARSNAKHMTLLPGVHFEQERYEESLKKCVDELAWPPEVAAKLGIILSVELQIGSIGPTPSRAERLLQLTSGLTQTLDSTHFTLQGIGDEDIEPLLRFASHFHARGACKGKLQASSKENTVDGPSILRAMN